MIVSKNPELEFAAVVDQNQGIIYKALEPYHPPPGNDWQDMGQVGLIGLWKAWKVYNSDDGALSTLAIKIIRRDVVDLIRSATSGAQQPVNESVDLDNVDIEPEGLTGIYTSVEEKVLLRNWLENFTKALLELPEARRKAVFEVWFAGFTTEESAQRLGRSRSAVKSDLFTVRHGILEDHAELPF